EQRLDDHALAGGLGDTVMLPAAGGRGHLGELGSNRAIGPLSSGNRSREAPMLVNCAAYQEGHKLADIPKEDITKYVKRPDCFVWVALKDPSAEELEEMREEFGLHELAVEDAHHGHQRPKIEEYGDSLFAVLHTVENQGDDLGVGEVDIFVGPNYILSIRI